MLPALLPSPLLALVESGCLLVREAPAHREPRTGTPGAWGFEGLNWASKQLSELGAFPRPSDETTGPADTTAATWRKALGTGTLLGRACRTGAIR